MDDFHYKRYPSIYKYLCNNLFHICTYIPIGRLPTLPILKVGSDGGSYPHWDLSQKVVMFTIHYMASKFWYTIGDFYGHFYAEKIDRGIVF